MPFRPNNLNKRLYPGNASVVGPTIQATLGITTTQCRTCTACCSACQFYPLTLGQRCSYCGCPCCQCVDACNCTVCTKNVPSGSWKISEQYSASVEGAWGVGSTSSNTPSSFLCFTANSISNIANITDYFGNLYSGSVGSSGRVASPCRLCVTWFNRANATTGGGVLGGSGWYIPNNTEHNTMRACRTYLGFPPGFHWSDQEFDANRGSGAYLASASLDSRPKSYIKVSRAIRNV